MPGGPFRAAIYDGTVSTAPVFVSENSVAMQQGVPVIFVAQAVGNPTLSMGKLGSLPAGLSGSDYGNGHFVIAGTPTGTGTGTVTLIASNNLGEATPQVLTITVAAAPVDPSPVFLSPSGMNNTGASDVSGAMQSWIDNVPDGDTMNPVIMRLRPGTYRVENIIWLRFRKNFVFDMSAATVIANTDGSGLTLPGKFDLRQRSQFIFTCCENFVVYEPVVRGPNPVSNYKLDSIYVVELELQHALRFAGCKDYEVSGGVLSRTYGDGIYVGYGQPAAATHQLCQRGWIHGTEVTTTGRQGISPCGQSDFVIENGYNHHNGRASFDFEPIGFPAAMGGSDPDTFGVFNTHLIGWRFGPSRLFTIAHKGSGLTDTFVIKNCYGDAVADAQFKAFFGSSNFNNGDPGEQRYNLWVVGNNFPGSATQLASGGGHGAIQMQRYTRAYIGGNTIPVQNRAYKQDVVYDDATPPNVIARDPLYVAGREPLVQAAYCTDVLVTGNTDNGAPQVKYAWAHTDTAYTPSATPPSPPVCGAIFARRSTGGWTP